MDDADRLDEAECLALLDRLFPHGPAGEDVTAELAPDGWAASPLSGLLATEDPQFQARELVTMCLWDIFSDNHDVTTADGRLAELGSFRGSAGTLADWVNRSLGHPVEPEPSIEEQVAKFMAQSEAMKKATETGDWSALMARPERDGVRVYDYMDFYMGTTNLRGGEDGADLSGPWRMIFRRLREAGCDWRYSHPRIGLVSFAKPEDDADPADYDPSAAFAAEQEREEKERATNELREGLDEAYRESVEAARQGPPPPLVQAYEVIYGQSPEGWPPEVGDE